MQNRWGREDVREEIRGDTQRELREFKAKKLKGERRGERVGAFEAKKGRGREKRVRNKMVGEGGRTGEGRERVLGEFEAKKSRGREKEIKKD